MRNLLLDFRHAGRLPDRDFFRRLAIGMIRQEFLDRIGQLQLTLLFQLQNGGAGEILVDLSEVEFRVLAVRHLPCPVCLAVSLVEQKPGVCGYPNDSGKLVGFGLGLDIFTNGRNQGVIVLPRIGNDDVVRILDRLEKPEN